MYYIVLYSIIYSIFQTQISKLSLKLNDDEILYNYDILYFTRLR